MTLIHLFLILQMAWASGGNTVKNGGNYARCPSAPQTSDVYSHQIAIFDIFQGHEYKNFSYKHLAAYRGKPFASAFPQAVREFFARSQEPQISILNQFSQFSKNVSFVETLPDIGPAQFSWASLMHGCTIGAAAVQFVTTHAPASTPVLIQLDKAVWKSLETDQKIALMIHEYIEVVYFQYIGTCIFTLGSDVVGKFLSDQARDLSEANWTGNLRFNCNGSIDANDPTGSDGVDH